MWIKNINPKRLKASEINANRGEAHLITNKMDAKKRHKSTLISKCNANIRTKSMSERRLCMENC